MVKFVCQLREHLQIFSGCIIKIWFSVEHLTKGLAFYCIDACCSFHSLISVKQVHISCAQVVCTFGSMVFASILLVRGIWSGVTYIRENRYSYIHRIDNDENRWSRVQTAGWYFAFLLYEQTPHPALAGYIIQKKKIWSAMNKMLPGPVPTTTIVIARPCGRTRMKRIHMYLHRISGSFRAGRLEDWWLSWS